ncbi:MULTISPECIES: hypothetical protein [Paenibacillus]|uniref:hypothetical protein n=1 Tax=Paenibacillus TaxID=44249 RepID=UPI0004BBE2E2|nr:MULTISPECIES: hypothetical protein [Paenibacillus]
MPENTGLKFTMPAMRILENEHRYLSFLMEEWHALVLWFEHDQPVLEESRTQLHKLRKAILEFTGPLKKHTVKEETFFSRCLAVISALNKDHWSASRRSTARLTDI